MTTEDIPSDLAVSLSAVIELAIECWRLEQWLAALPPPTPAAKGRHVLRRWQKFLTERELTALDLTGQRYEAGMAVDVIEALTDASLGERIQIVDEMIAPVILWRGRVVRHGQVVIRQGAQ